MESLTGMARESSAKGSHGKTPESFSAACYDIRPAIPEDAQAICALFNKIFPDEMSLSHWQWKYQREQSRAIVAYRDGKLIAHYGGVGTDILMEGGHSTAIQVADLMVDPSERQAVRQNSPFFLMASAFLDNYVGYEKPFYLGYGFPSDRAMALSDRLGLFTPIGIMHEITWEINGADFPQSHNLTEITQANFADYTDRINSLWMRFSKNLAQRYVCKKDAAFILWRYLEHPAKTYAIYLVTGRFTGKAKYLLVMRHDQQKSMLMDILTSKLDLVPAIKLAKQLAWQQGNRKLVTWCSETDITRFKVEEAEDKILPVAIPANTRSPGPAPDSQMDKWWFMPGDTDYL
jgi:hypothetical protein